MKTRYWITRQQPGQTEFARFAGPFPTRRVAASELANWRYAARRKGLFAGDRHEIEVEQGEFTRPAPGKFCPNCGRTS